MPWIPSGSGFGVTLYPSPFCSVHQKPDPCENHLRGLGAPAFWLPVAFRAVSEQEEGGTEGRVLVSESSLQSRLGLATALKVTLFPSQPRSPSLALPLRRRAANGHC